MVDPLSAGLALGSMVLANQGNKGQDTTPRYNPAVEPAIGETLGKVTNRAPVNVFDGTRVAPLTQRQNTGLSMADSLASMQQDTQQGVNNQFNKFAGGEFVGSNPYLEAQIQAMQKSGVQNLQRNILPSVRNNAIAGGSLGGSRQGIAEGLAMSDANQQAIDAETAMRGGAYKGDMDNMLAALLNQGNILSGQAAPMNTMLSAGALEQTQGQNVINADMAQNAEQNDLQYQRDLSLLQTLLNTQQSQPQVVPQTNPLAAGLGTYTALQSLNNPQAPSSGSNPAIYAPSSNWASP